MRSRVGDGTYVGIMPARAITTAGKPRGISPGLSSLSLSLYLSYSSRRRTRAQRVPRNSEPFPSSPFFYPPFLLPLRSGVPEHGTAIGHDGPVRGSGIRAESMRPVGRFAFQGPGESRDQQGVGNGHAGQTSRRPGPVRGRRARLQARGHRTAAVLQFAGK